jgi:hypothetical protein
MAWFFIEGNPLNVKWKGAIVLCQSRKKTGAKELIGFPELGNNRREKNESQTFDPP